MKNLTARKKDILLLILVVIISCPISYYLSKVGFLTFEPPIYYIWYIFLAVICYISYLESRDKDPFVTGKTQTMGVSNSFTSAPFLIGVMSKWFTGWVFSAILVSVCLFISREFGRYSYRKREDNYLNKTGVLLGDLPNKAKAEIDGKKVTVWSKEEIKGGTPIRISEIKATYLYVSPLDTEK